ncbi:hypothetical protein SAMN05421504_10385 [Amycolatopsis xylanica]|uniref:Uncharacterized protein n=1 Tax=Amycolatopsis xylanica TaxID=589385 RepID=A0A1H3CNW0_9PSEU|nr:hypothetical protein SAMN05421504_10385 [Amycolatopsis xylanica]
MGGAFIYLGRMKGAFIYLGCMEGAFIQQGRMRGALIRRALYEGSLHTGSRKPKAHPRESSQRPKGVTAAGMGTSTQRPR